MSALTDTEGLMVFGVVNGDIVLALLTPQCPRGFPLTSKIGLALDRVKP